MTAQAQSARLRAEAKDILNFLFNKLFNIPEDYHTLTVGRLVDCLIAAAVLQVTALQEQAAEEGKP